MTEAKTGETSSLDDKKLIIKHKTKETTYRRAVLVGTPQNVRQPDIPKMGTENKKILIHVQRSQSKKGRFKKYVLSDKAVSNPSFEPIICKLPQPPMEGQLSIDKIIEQMHPSSFSIVKRGSLPSITLLPFPPLTIL